ncbi:MAG: putative ABC transporter permease [Clostridia bacterium]
MLGLLEKSDKRDLIKNKKISFTDIVFIFIICAFLGWVIEVLYVYLNVGRIVSRGMLYGPFCTIYGFGSLILYLLFYNLKPSKINIPYTFLTSACVMGAFELVCGLGFKYILGIEMWNYSGKFLSILNYTTVPILIGWGILGTIYVFFLQPFLMKIISFIPKNITKRLAIIITVMYFMNFVLSVFNIHLNPEILYKLVNP